MPDVYRRKFLISVRRRSLNRLLPNRHAMTETHRISNDLARLALHDASLLVKNRKASSVQLVETCLKRIELLNPYINAFITITGKLALGQAQVA